MFRAVSVLRLVYARGYIREVYAELGSIDVTVSIKAKNEYRRYICICICIYYKNYKSICNRIY